MQTDVARQFAAEGDLAQLSEHDQLKRSMSRNTAFRGYTE